MSLYKKLEGIPTATCAPCSCVMRLANRASERAGAPRPVVHRMVGGGGGGGVAPILCRYASAAITGEVVQGDRRKLI